SEKGEAGVTEDETEVPPHDAHAATRAGERGEDAVEIAANDGHRGGGEGQIRAPAEGDADVGGLQGCRVVDAVPDDGHGAAAAAEPGDDPLLLLGGGVGVDEGDAGLAGDGARRLLAVAGDEGDAHAEPPEGGDEGDRAVPQRLLDGDGAREAA